MSPHLIFPPPRRAPALLIACLLTLSASWSLAQTPSENDLRALRYYRSQNDTVSYEAELRRLRVQFPDWSPPADPLAGIAGAAGPSVEIDEIYRLIAAGAFDAADARIGEVRLTHPGWNPPKDMTELLELSRAQATFDQALASADVGRAAQVSAERPILLSCQRINNPWRLAEAQRASGATGEALRLMQGIVRTCENVDLIIATLEKTDAFATPEQMAQLFAEARSRFPAQTTIWDGLATRLTKGHGQSPPIQRSASPRSVSGTATVPTVTRPASAATPRSSSGAASLSRSATRNPTQCLASTSPKATSGQALTRAWCAYDMQRPLEALGLFRRAEAAVSVEQKRDARFGQALAMLKLGMPDGAARVAAATDLTHQQRLDVELWILDQRGVQAYQQGKYERAVAFFDAFTKLAGFERRDLAILRAYALLNMGKRQAAHAAFQTLHDALATEETRHGLMASAR